MAAPLRQQPPSPTPQFPSPHRTSLIPLCLLLLLCAATTPLSGSPPHGHSRYCILGAGPGGLQLGHYMHRAGRDYRLFERSAGAGSFFEAYPVHGTLISLNKRHTGRDSPTFNMRHDWNSLLDSDVTPMTRRTRARWPRRETLLGYLRDFAAAQADAGRIEFDTDVTAIRRARDPDPDLGGSGFELSLRREGQALRHGCEVVVVATGLSVPNRPAGMVGVEHTTLYSELPEEQARFEAQKVAVFGLGNAAFETANALAPVVDYVHVFPGRAAASLPLVSWETRYPGSVRALNADLLDAYLLKSVDGGLQQGRLELGADSMAVFRCGDGGRQRCLFPFRRSERHPAAAAQWPDERTVTVGYFCAKNSWAMGFVQSLGGAVLAVALQSNVTLAERVHRPGGHGGQVTEQFAFSCKALQLVVPLAAITERNVDDFARFAKESGDPYPLTYDHVILAVGWRHDRSIYAEGTLPLMQPNRKYPVLSHEYESANVAGLFFAGALAHGKDYKRSAGGFIHGLRYTARCLFRILEARYEAEPWPTQEYVFRGAREDRSNLEALVERTLTRIDEGDAPYQMVGAVGDGIVFECPRAAGSKVSAIKASYLEDVPVPYFNTVHANASRLLWTFGYNGQRRSLSESVRGGTLFQVHLWNYAGSCDPPPLEGDDDNVAGKEVVVFTEQLHTEWNQQFNSAVLTNLMRAKLQAMFTQKPQPQQARQETGEAFDREGWGVGDIYAWFSNDLPHAARVSALATDGGGAGGPEESEAVLGPGEGRQLAVADGQEWRAEVTDKVAAAEYGCGGVGVVRFDVAMGKVQDVLLSRLLGAAEQDGDGQECPAAEGEGKGRGKKKKGKKGKRRGKRG